MATQFHFEHVFRAASIDDVFSAYFDPAHVSHQDQQLEISERLVIEQTDDGETLRRTCKITPRRQLPTIVRPFLAGPLHYLEKATWRRADRTIEVEIWPSLLRKKPRPTVTALYRLSQLSSGGSTRSYEGQVCVDLPVFSTRIEHGIVAELERSLAVTATCTQAFLDRGGRYVSART